MRTTLSLDDDVAAQMRQLQRESQRPWKQIVDQVLRAGLAAVEAGEGEPTETRRTAGVRLGLPMLGNVANVHDVLSLAEGDGRA